MDGLVFEYLKKFFIDLPDYFVLFLIGFSFYFWKNFVIKWDKVINKIDDLIPAIDSIKNDNSKFNIDFQNNIDTFTEKIKKIETNLENFTKEDFVTLEKIKQELYTLKMKMEAIERNQNKLDEKIDNEIRYIIEKLSKIITLVEPLFNETGGFRK